MKRLVAALVAMIAAVLAAGAAYTAAVSQKAERDFPPSGDFVVVGDARLRYLSGGEGTAVVLLHGNPGSADDWQPLLDSLSWRYRYVAFDRPGHGYSSRGDAAAMTPARQAEAVHAALAGLGVGRTVIVGHSWGAGLALIYALKYPTNVSALVLMGPRAFRLPGDEGFVYRLTRTPVAGTVFRHTVMLPVGRSMTEAGLAAAYAPEPVDTLHSRSARALWLRPTQAAAIVWDSWNLQKELGTASQRYNDIKAPVVVLVGEHDDRMAEAVPLARALPGAELQIVPAAGHYMNRTRPEVVLSAIDRLIARKR